MIRGVGVPMDRFNMDFNDKPLNPQDEHPVCPKCGGMLAHLQTVSSDSVLLPSFEFSLFHCETDGMFYRTRSGTAAAHDSGVRAPANDRQRSTKVPSPFPNLTTTVHVEGVASALRGASWANG